MNSLSNYQPNMSATEQREMAARLNRIFQIASSTQVAMDVCNSVQGQGWVTYTSAVNQAKFLLAASQQAYPDEASERAFQHWQNNLESNLNQIYGLLFNHLIQILDSIPVEPSQPGFWEEVGNQILLLLANPNPPADPIINQMRQLEAQAKRALAATADAHSKRLPPGG